MNLITDADLAKAAEDIGCDLPAAKAFSEVESRGAGFDTNGLPKILFERHQFYKYLKLAKGEAVASDVMLHNQDICSQKPGGYTAPNTSEHARLQKAASWDRDAALMSASWGRFQVMGFNWKTCGYQSLRAFINDAYTGEDGHLRMFTGFVKADQKLRQAIIDHDWAEAARRYNGADYAKNAYDKKLAAAYSKFGGT